AIGDVEVDVGDHLGRTESLAHILERDVTHGNRSLPARYPSSVTLPPGIATILRPALRAGPPSRGEGRCLFREDATCRSGDDARAHAGIPPRRPNPSANAPSQRPPFSPCGRRWTGAQRRDG